MNKQNSSQISYADKDVFVGLDVHKKTYAVVARVEGAIAEAMDDGCLPIKAGRAAVEIFPRWSYSYGL